MSALQKIIAQRIELAGPMGLQEYMAHALYHPQHGYYRTRDPLGTRGDFTTAPEISQMFGELIGAWVAAMWAKMGHPMPFTLLECGPGWGTMMADMLRVMRGVPGFAEAARIYLLEVSPTLKEKQRAMLRDYPVTWVETFSDVPQDAPVIIVGNEFWDAFPVQQFVRQDDAWREVMVGARRDGALFLTHRPAMAFGGKENAAQGFVWERSESACALFREMGARVKRQGGAMLFIDYGYEQASGRSTVQAVKAHARHDILHTPGEADITAHVDFGAMKAIATECGLSVFGTISQGEFLRRLGIEQRKERLAAGATQAQQDALSAALERLTGRQHMGDLFKVMAVSKNTVIPEGF